MNSGGTKFSAAKKIQDVYFSGPVQEALSKSKALDQNMWAFLKLPRSVWQNKMFSHCSPDSRPEVALRPPSHLCCTSQCTVQIINSLLLVAEGFVIAQLSGRIIYHPTIDRLLPIRNSFNTSLVFSPVHYSADTPADAYHIGLSCKKMYPDTFLHLHSSDDKTRICYHIFLDFICYPIFSNEQQEYEVKLTMVTVALYCNFAKASLNQN